MKVLIAYDGSDEAKKAIEALARMGLPREAEALVATLVEVWPPMPRLCFGEAAREEGRILGMARRLARLALAEAMTTAREGAQRVGQLFPGWTVQVEACLEPTPGSLLKKEEEWGADCLLVSAKELRHRGRHGPNGCDSLPVPDCPDYRWVRLAGGVAGW